MNLEQAFALATEHHRHGELAQAESLYRQILAIAPHSSQVLSLLAEIFDQTNRPAEAESTYRQIISLTPTDPDAHVGLGNSLRQLGDLDGAIAAYRAAIALRPGYAGAQNNLANALWDGGDLDGAIALLRQAASSGTDSAAASNLLFALHFDPSITPRQLRAEHDQWNERFARPLLTASHHPNTPDPERRLKIGYVSPDFHHHPIAIFMLPLLENHDREHFEIACYSDAVPDTLTLRLAGLTSLWRDTRAHSDSQFAEQIRADQIDILVDLTLHSRGSRLLAFAPKPAPVQVTYLGYPSTTGLQTIDYRLSDPWLDPPDSDTSIYSEQTFRLPSSYWCYRPVFDVPPPGPLPASTNCFITLGCLNNFYKIRPAALEAWRTILLALPDSRLILHAHPGSHRARVLEFFQSAEIAAHRIEFVGAQSLAHYFETYRRIDIALDPFPFPGATTTLDALWSGVPVITLAGQSASSRAGVSILSNLDLPDLISQDREHYIAITKSLATDLPRLAALRSTLRPRLQSSPLTQAPRFARDIETAFRQMWNRWCSSLH